jgi:ferredoxin--NADP+ reductase
MSLATLPSEQEIKQLRQDKYNACVVDRIDIHEELMLLRVCPDNGVTAFSPGQYSVMGLGYWEQRVPDCDEEQLEDKDIRRVAKRAYSFSCSMLDNDGQLRSPQEFPFLEFYVVLVRQGEEGPPGLTPRLFSLAAGDRLFVGPKATGHYSLDGIEEEDNIILAATGTGEAPHNAMVAQLLSQEHQGKIVSITCVRLRNDLGYLQTHRQLESEFSNYRYLPLTTREPENLALARPDYVGRRYLQDYFADGELEKDSGVAIEPQGTHIFLCGNPQMIGAPQKNEQGELHYPQSFGMLEFLERRGFQRDERHAPGNIHFEKYW